MNLDQAIEVLSAHRDKASLEYDAYQEIILAAKAAQETDAATKNAKRERTKVETELTKFKENARVEGQAIAVEVQLARDELAKVKAAATAIQEKQRSDYAKAEAEHHKRVAELEKDRMNLLNDRLQLRTEIDVLDKQKKRMEELARAMLPA